MPVSTRSNKVVVHSKIKRNVTSAVEGLTVADVRRCLDKVRKSWADLDKTHFSLLIPVNDNLTIQDFCFRFVLGHHRKRHAKSKTKTRASS